MWKLSEEGPWVVNGKIVVCSGVSSNGTEYWGWDKDKHLIAASPYLLQALEDLLDEQINAPSEIRRSQWEFACKQAQHAIKTAKNDLQRNRNSEGCRD